MLSSTPQNKQVKLCWEAANGKKVLLSDEKKFNLECNFKLYWHDKDISRRYGGGSSVMIKEQLSFRLYRGCASNRDWLHCPCLCGNDWVFQQDNAAIHTTCRTKDFFMVNNVILLYDMNPIENVWVDCKGSL